MEEANMLPHSRLAAHGARRPVGDRFRQADRTPFFRLTGTPAFSLRSLRKLRLGPPPADEVGEARKGTFEKSNKEELAALAPPLRLDSTRTEMGPCLGKIGNAGPGGRWLFSSLPPSETPSHPQGRRGCRLRDRLGWPLT